MAPNDDSDNRVPRLVNRADFKNWTIRLKHHLCSIDNDLWKSIDKGPHIPTQTTPDSASTYTKDSTEPYPEDNLSPEDLRKVKNDSKAYSLMCKGMPLQVLSRLDAYQTGYTLFKALKSICEGGEQLRSLKKQKLKRQRELFEHIAGESVHQMMNRFVHLTTEMTNVGAKTDLQDLNDRLLCALPSSWKQTVTLLKHTEKFPMDLALLIAKIEEVEIDEIQETLTDHDAAKPDDEGDLFVGASFTLIHHIYQAHQFNLNLNLHQEFKFKANDETKNAFTVFMASFQAYLGRHLTQLDVVLQDLFEMDPDDVEEMDLNWQMVMNHGQSQNSQQSSSYQNRNQRFMQKPYQSLPMPEDQNKELVVSVKDGYDWSAYAEQFTSDLTSSLALVCEIEEEDWSEDGDDQVIKAVSEDSEYYDWSAKSDPIEESESEIALMATSEESFSSAEQPKVSIKLPPNYVPLPDDVKGRLCSDQCIKQVEHYRTHSFKISDKLSKHERIHKQLKIDHKISDEKILSLERTGTCNETT
ncbi:hypothetical protein QVD17_24340 [Tagetes erecta]|uniref:DUF4219 domain-containing protein n=1 Tax=Tagetes erecta TaxID=13708 RepID=A0AAD8KEZ8_TARER|nr:hypothetical protein QVD17_24340 [Tagetes erecta]